MSASLGDDALVLGKVRTKQIQRLLSAVLDSRLRNRKFIEQRYGESAGNFSETLHFLTEVGWIAEQEGELVLLSPLSTVSNWLRSDESIRQAILSALVAESSPYRRPVATYLNEFTVSDGELKHRPSVSERTQQRPVRDLLMDLRAVSYQSADECYVLDDYAVPMFVWATNFVKPRSPLVYAAAHRRREELGFAAELAVIDYERQRLGDSLAHLIEHISADQPYACYDIKSATFNDGQLVDRFIEVKAVPERTLQFYWSKSEIEAAEILREKYYLYLVPFVIQRGFDLDAITTIRDPHATLISDTNTWEFESEVLVCRRRL